MLSVFKLAVLFPSFIDLLNISSVCVEEHSEKEIVIRLAGASCVYYYVFEINGVQYSSSEKDFFIHQAVAGYYYHVTVSGMSYFNQNFTSISSDFYFGGISKLIDTWSYFLNRVHVSCLPYCGFSQFNSLHNNWGIIISCIVATVAR